MGGALRLSAQAERDLKVIVRYIARDDRPAAGRFGLAFLARAESLTSTPNLGIRVRGWPGVRALLHRNYYVVYRCTSQDDGIEIIRFWHSARDLGAARPTDFDV